MMYKEIAPGIFLEFEQRSFDTAWYDSVAIVSKIGNDFGNEQAIVEVDSVAILTSFIQHRYEDCNVITSYVRHAMNNKDEVGEKKFSWEF